MDIPDNGDSYAEAFDRYAPAILRYAQRRLDNHDQLIETPLGNRSVTIGSVAFTTPSRR